MQANIYKFLEEHGIPYERHDHEAVFTVEEQDRLQAAISGIKTKNLFLRDQPGKRHVLVVAESKKTVDLKAVGDMIGAKRLGFASPERMARHLGVTPGAVSVFGLVNDTDRAVELLVDRDVWESELVRAHPLVNTSTIVVAGEGLRNFLKATGHEPRVIDIP
jgi:Ala-tRNA(Pro) deacylase